jgi:hypothetical protein
MIRRYCTAALTIVVFVLAGAACASGIVPLAGSYAFSNNMNPYKARCVKVSDGFLQLFRSHSYVCYKPEVNSASGENFIQCDGNKDTMASYMIMKTRSSCEKELRTERANYDGS